MKHKASITIEAAIVVPIVFFSLLLVYSLMHYLQMEYQITHAAHEAAVEFSYESHLYHELELTEVIAHFSKKRQSLEASDITDWQEKSGEMVSSPNAEKLEDNVKTWIRVSKDLVEKIIKVPAEWKNIAKTEATILTTRAFFDSFLKGKIIHKLQGKIGFQADKLDILAANYFYDMKSSQWYVRYLYEFQVPFPFLKPAEIKIPIHVDSFTGNIKRYEGEDYKPKEEENKQDKTIVYVTQTGARYHTNLYCNSIYRQVDKVQKASVAKGTECKTCQKKKHVFTDFVYKTEKSNIYHAVETCTQIYRQVSEITLEEAQERGLSHCKNCDK